MKHEKSRRPSSWKQEKITRTFDEAMELIKGFVVNHTCTIDQEIYITSHLSLSLSLPPTPLSLPPSLCVGYREKIESGETTFAKLASSESDCGSARKGGDLGVFGRGQMQSKHTYFSLKSFPLLPPSLSPMFFLLSITEPFEEAT